MDRGQIQILETQLATAKDKAKSLAAIADKSGHDERSKWQEQADFWRQRANELEQELAKQREGRV